MQLPCNIVNPLMIQAWTWLTGRLCLQATRSAPYPSLELNAPPADETTLGNTQGKSCAVWHSVVLNHVLSLARNAAGLVASLRLTVAACPAS